MSTCTPQQPNPPQNINCGNVNSSYNNTWNNCDFSVTDERRQILEWLSPLAPRLRHQDVRKSQVEGVGNWLLQTDEFINWNGGEDGVSSPVLFCYGDPGVGKTHLSSLVIETLCHQSYGKQVAVTCVYCDFHAHKEQSTTRMLGSILKQLVGGMEHIPEEIEEAFRRSKRQLDGRELELGEILKLLMPSLRTVQRSYICVDALDEFSREDRPELLKSLAQITRESPGTRLFITGRQHIREEVGRYFTERVEIRITPTEEDIERYISMRLSKDTEPKAMGQSLREKILKTLPEKISKIFLLVSLSMNAILAQSTIRRRRDMLNQMTDGLGMGGAYAATLERIIGQDGDKGKLGMGVLMWVSRAERPLQAVELCHALAIEEDSTELDPDNAPAIETLISCCQGLVTMDDEGSRVRLIHLTLQEYLWGHPDLFGSSRPKMGEVCLTYLNFQNINDLPCDLQEAPKTAPFLDYASCYWGVHAGRELTESTKSLAHQLLKRYDHHLSGRLLLESIARLPGGDFYPWHMSTFTSLDAIAYFGIGEIATALISPGCEVNRRGPWWFTPLMWAARNNNGGVCKVLLELGDADPNIASRSGETPLFIGSACGHESIVKLLLEREEVNPNSPNNYGSTPLQVAAMNGHESIVKLLLGRKKVNPGSSDKGGGTPLWGAARNGHEGVVKLLLERKEVNPGSPNNSGSTPLWMAAMNGHEGIVKLLLERKEVNPDSPNTYGSTPLQVAAVNGHEGIVELLLERKEVNPDSRNNCGGTPLHMAAMGGHEGIVKLLLECKKVNPDSSDESGATPLWGAARNGHEGVVKLLLERKEVNPNSPDNCGCTPLQMAAMYGYEVIVKLLLELGGVNPNSAGNDGQTLLFWATKDGHKGIARLLQARPSNNSPTPEGNDEKTGSQPPCLLDSTPAPGIISGSLNDGNRKRKPHTP